MHIIHTKSSFGAFVQKNNKKQIHLHYTFIHEMYSTETALELGLGLWCLTPFSTKFQLYRGDQFYRWRNLVQPYYTRNVW
jgi:hypothetical protein